MEEEPTVVTATSKRGGTQAVQRARAEETRIMLMRTARSMFAELGYHQTGTIALVSRAEVTSGALYHHFRDKKTLFTQIFLEVLDDLRLSAEAEARRRYPLRWDRITSAFTTYLRMVAASPEFQRIVLVDGPAVFGWPKWREYQAEHVATGIQTSLTLLMEDGLIADQPAEPLANLLLGALNEAALAIAHAPDPLIAQDEVSTAFGNLLRGLRLPAPSADEKG